jgi:hypothetical protein
MRRARVALQKTRAASVALGLCLLAPPALAQTAPEGLRAFQDWRVACDETRACVALGLAPQDKRQIETQALRLRVAPGPDGARALDARLGARDLAEPRLDSPGDGRPLDKLLKAARRGGVMAFFAPDGAKGEISLAGLPEALTYIDRAQGRAGTRAALIELGDKPAAQALPPASPAPLAARPFAGKQEPASTALVRRLRAGDPNCDGRHGQRTSGLSWALDAKRALVELQCVRGAYNLQSAYWIVEEQTATPLRFEAPGEKPDDRLINPSVDPAKGEIETNALGRSLGDCGAKARYVWTGERFQLAAYAALNDCVGLPPQWWPTIVRGAR